MGPSEWLRIVSVGASSRYKVTPEGQSALSCTFIYRKDAQEWARDIEVRQKRGFTPVDTRALRNTTLGDLFERHTRTITATNREAEIETMRIAGLRRSDMAKLSLAAATSDKFAEYRDQRLAEVALIGDHKDVRMLFR